MEISQLKKHLINNNGGIYETRLCVNATETWIEYINRLVELYWFIFF
jgi:hypothetical protein